MYSFNVAGSRDNVASNEASLLTLSVRGSKPSWDKIYFLFFKTS